MKKSNPNNVNRKNTKRGILICSILLSVFICAGVLSIHAYFTDTATVFNDFTVGNNVIEVIDEDNVIVKNMNDDQRAVPCYIRVFVAKEDGSTLPDYNTTNWELKGDYYYYKDVVDPEDATEALFDPPVSGTSESNKLIVYAESIQAEGFDYLWNETSN